MRHQIVILLLLVVLSQQKTKDEWKSRTMYQLITDRFARGDGKNTTCEDIHSYCGGDFRGLINNLDYIAGMGFDAIWISPIVSNYEGQYHGYAAMDLYAVNPMFGTAEDLKELVSEAHKRDIWVMVDVVANHMGNMDMDYSRNNPFNESSHYHDYCIISDLDFAIHDMDNIEYCRLSAFADLDQDNPYVRAELLKYVQFVINEYGFDGMRLDTVMQIKGEFWQEFTDAAGVYSIGEVFDSDAHFISQFIGPIDSLLNYPLFYHLRDVFGHWKDMNSFEGYYQRWEDAIGRDAMQYLGNFNDNHDNIRFLNNHIQTSVPLLNSALTYSHLKLLQFKAITAFCLTSFGIPVIYYGTEQQFDGYIDPLNREILWNNLDTNNEMYKFIATINAAKKATGAASEEQIQRYSDADVYAFTRGQLFAAFSSKYDKQVIREITYHPYKEGQRLCNIFWPNDDCVTVQQSKFKLYINYGEVKIFVPA